MQLQQFDQKRLTSVEKEFRQSPEDVERSDTKEAMDLSNWIQAQLGSKAAKVKITNRLASHPCVITGAYYERAFFQLPTLIVNCVSEFSFYVKG